MANRLLKYGSRLFTSSAGTGVMKHVEETHKPDGRIFDVKPVLAVVEQIFNLTASASTMTAEDETHVSASVDTLESLGCTIHKIACEITCRCSGSGDGHETTMVLLKGPLSQYEWDAKAVLVLASFSTSYAEFWLTSQLHAVNNPLAKSVALLKQLPELLEHVDALKPLFDALNKLFAELLALTRCIIEFSDMPKDYISMDTPALEMALAYIPTAVYWIVKSVITCSSQVIGLICMGQEYLASTSETWELSNLAQKVKNIHDHLKKLLKKCLDLIDEKRQEESYRILERAFQTPHLDNMKLLRLMFPSQDDCPLILRHSSVKVNIDALHRKMLVLLISDLKIKQEELSFLKKIYHGTHGHGYAPAYEFVWVPIVDQVVPQSSITKPSAIKEISDDDKVLLGLAAKMPWYTAYPQPHHNSAFVRYIKKEWHFVKDKPILVVLDAQGKLANPNAMYMVYIWDLVAFPFSSSKEEALWKDETWKFELVVGCLDDTLSRWIREGKLVCLYGGENIEWIRNFTKAIKQIMKKASIIVEMVHVGKNHPNIHVKKNIEVIKKENLSRTWDFDTIWLFWTRLESMMHSNSKSERSTETDQILKEVIKLLTYGNSNYGWAMISKGSLDMVKAEGEVLTKLLENFDSWKDKIDTDGFNKAFQSGLDPLQSADHCVRLVLPSTSPVHKVSCPECKKIMERYLLFQCCDTQDDSAGPEEAAAATEVAGLPIAAATQAAILPSTVPAQPAAASPASAGAAAVQAAAASPASAGAAAVQAAAASPATAGATAVQAAAASPATAGAAAVQAAAASPASAGAAAVQAAAPSPASAGAAAVQAAAASPATAGAAAVQAAAASPATAGAAAVQAAAPSLASAGAAAVQAAAASPASAGAATVQAAAASPATAGAAAVQAAAASPATAGAAAVQAAAPSLASAGAAAVQAAAASPASAGAATVQAAAASPATAGAAAVQAAAASPASASAAAAQPAATSPASAGAAAVQAASVSPASAGVVSAQVAAASPASAGQFALDLLLGKPDL